MQSRHSHPLRKDSRGRRAYDAFGWGKKKNQSSEEGRIPSLRLPFLFSKLYLLKSQERIWPTGALDVNLSTAPRG